MKYVLVALVGVAALTSCAQKPESYTATDSTARDIQMPRADSNLALNDRPAPPPVPVTPPPRRTPAPPAPPPPVAAPAPAPAPAPLPPPAARLDAGTVVEAAATREITSRHNKAGELFTARISEAVTAPDGRVVIPAGSEVTLSIVALKPAPNKSAKDGTLELRAINVTVNGVAQPIDAEVSEVEHTLKGRGVTSSEAVKVGVGTAAGAILGRVIGGGGTGTAVGAATGAAGGVIVASETADRDVVVPVGAKIKLVLRSTFAVVP